MHSPMICPRCGSASLVSGRTAARKVCYDCPECGGRLVTFPVLKDGLGGKGIVALTQAVRTATSHGCRCPSCGGTMALLKVEVEGRKIEIDVCGACTSVWCDCGEFGQLVPASVPQEDRPSQPKDYLAKASPETRERFAKAMLDRVPEEQEPEITLVDLLTDIVRLAAGMPTLWRTTQTSTPVVTLLLSVALPAFQAVAYYCGGGELPLWGYRRFWVLAKSTLSAGGLSAATLPHSLFTYPFLQSSANTAVLLALLLAPLLTVIERRIGVRRLLVLLGSFWLTAAIAHLLVSWDGSLLYGFTPIAYGFVAYALTALADVRIRSPKGPTFPFGFLAAFVGVVLFFFRTLVQLLYCGFSFGVFPTLSVIALAIFLGRRWRQN